MDRGSPRFAEELDNTGRTVREVSIAHGSELIRMDTREGPSMAPDLSVLLATSGTTGSVKFARLSAGNIEANAAAIVDYLELTEAERPITSLPFHYSFGLSVLNSHWSLERPWC